MPLCAPKAWMSKSLFKGQSQVDRPKCCLFPVKGHWRDRQAIAIACWELKMIEPQIGWCISAIPEFGIPLPAQFWRSGCFMVRRWLKRLWFRWGEARLTGHLPNGWCTSRPVSPIAVAGPKAQEMRARNRKNVTTDSSGSDPSSNRTMSQLVQIVG